MANDKRSTATVIGTVESVSREIARGKFTFREVIVTEAGKYPNPIAIEFSGDNIGKASSLAPGDAVTIACNIRGREWTSPAGEVKHFLSLSGWKIDEHDKSGRGSDVPTGSAGNDYDEPLPFASASMGDEPSPIACALRRRV